MTWKDDVEAQVHSIKQKNEMADAGFSSQETEDKLAEYIEERKLVDEVDSIERNNAYHIYQKRTESFRERIPWVKSRVLEDDIEIKEDTRCINVSEEGFDD